jgi:hypothetical protein
MMNRMLISLILGVTSGVQAQEVREFFNGARAMAMGGASIAVVNDETALLSNPAGLGKLRDSYGTILDPEVEANSNLFQSYQVKPSGDPSDPTVLKPFLDENLDKYFHFREQIFPSFVVRNFGIGIYWRKTIDAKEDLTATTVNLNYYDDMALVMGYNFRLFDGRIKIGFNGKFISRIAVENLDIPVASSMALKDNAVEGAGIGSDVGIILTAPWTYLPTISAVVRDAGGTTFNSGSGLRLAVPNRPSKITQDIDVAVALFPIHSNRVRSAFTLEYQKMTAASLDTDKTKYMHAGYELNVGDLFFVRAGMNQKYWTAGLELASEHTQIQLSSYGEEVGTAGSPVEDRRSVFKFAFRF